LSSTAAGQADAETVVLIHGMWMTPLSWEHWITRYTDQGHHVLAPAWPGLEAEPEQLRRDPSPLAGLGVKEVVDHYDRIIRGLDRPPVIIGHSFGGLFTQILLDRGLGAAGVAIGTGAPKGVFTLPYSTIKSAWPALGNPANLNKVTPLTAEQFHYRFTNTQSRAESDAIYARYYIPGAARPFFQAGLANFNPKAVTKVDFKNPSRPPLLLITGSEDHISPPSVNKENLKRQQHAKSPTEYHEYPRRSHFIAGQEGWEQVADYALSWASRARRAGG
jgi:pimeloyl-ACP methyl ester carboxylesterase